MTEKYLQYLDVLRSGEEVIGDIYGTDVYDWVMSPFESLLTELAPTPPVNLKAIQLTLQQYLFPGFFIFNLDIVDEKLCPRRITTQKTSPYRPSFIRLEEDFLDDLEGWTAFYDPDRIVLSFKTPEDALFKQPRKVLIENGTVECFFKPCHSGVQLKRELQIYKKIMANDLNGQLNLCYMHGVVLDDYNFVLGIMLSYIDCADRPPLSMIVHPDEANDPPVGLRRRWMGQLDSAIEKFHEKGIIWGDVKAENVLIDVENNAWITDFGGGYTEGWVDRELVETIEGDVMGMKKIRQLLFPLG